MKRLPYLLALDQMWTGDQIFFSGTKDVAQTIQLATGSIYSHVAVVVRLDEIMPHYPRDRVYFVESVGSGLELRNARARLRNDLLDGSICHWCHLQLTDDQRDRAREFALVECGKGIPYDFGSLFIHLVTEPPLDYGRYICSEFGQACLISCGLELPADRALDPGELAKALWPFTIEMVDLIGPGGK